MIAGGASCIGVAHLRSGVPLQDAYQTYVDPKGNYSIVIVSDGAGSAKFAEVGSARISTNFISEIRALCSQENKVAFDSFKETVYMAVQSTRTSLVTEGFKLNDCHATIVACVAFKDRCYLAHLGDGIQVVFIEEPNGDIAVCVSEPENGEASNETFFYTEDAWRDRLRLTEIPRNVLACMLMSDGMEDFIWNPQSGLKTGFCRPLIQRARDGSNSIGGFDKVLAEVVSDKRTDQFTNDDKTLCLVVDPSAYDSLIDDRRSLNQYTIRDGRPVRFEAQIPKLDHLGEAGKPEAVKIPASLGDRPENSLGKKDPSKEKNKAEKGYYDVSKLVTFFLYCITFVIGLISGFLVNELKIFTLSSSSKTVEVRSATKNAEGQEGGTVSVTTDKDSPSATSSAPAPSGKAFPLNKADAPPVAPSPSVILPKAAPALAPSPSSPPAKANVPGKGDTRTEAPLSKPNETTSQKKLP